jgi:nicotinamidase-related amidase
MNQPLVSGDGTALLVIDMQDRVIGDAWHRSETITNVATAVGKARQAGVPVVWVRHSSDTMQPGSDGWQIVDELVPEAGEPIVEKQYGDAFEDTDLQAVLSKLGVKHLVVCGAQSDACIISTLFGGFVRGYDMTLIGDSHTTDDYSAYGLPAPEAVIALINGIWSHRTAPGRIADVVTTDTLPFAGLA